ncbi:MAG: aldehyde dehydrogenase [Clostridia bacterium]|nr:aldehyde dehydrogenase [Clostridia bacterium]
MNPMDYVSKTPYKLYINGEYVAAEKGKIVDVNNPATNKPFAQVYRGTVEDCEKAIKAARKAFDEGPWGRTAARDRAKILMKAAEIMERRAEEFAVLEALECGYHYGSARYYCVPMAVDAFNFFAGKARTLEGSVVPSDYGTLNYVTWNPVGVVAEILPWNGPYLMGCQKINAILAAGNTCVIKPPSWGMLTLLQLAGVYEEAGLPAGVFNVVTGSGSEIGTYLTEHPDVDMVAMTGGTETGREVIRNSAEHVKDIALELGGKSPNIFFEDVNVKDAAKWAVWGFTNHSGEICVSGTRVLVQRSIYDEFVEEMKKFALEKYIPGDTFDFSTNLDPLISKSHAESVWEKIESGKAEGARLVCGGERFTEGQLAEGNFVPVTIFADVTPEMTIFQEEIFGPVGCVTPFDTEEEAIALANGTRFGLAGGVFTKDLARGIRVANNIKSGQIYVNNYFSKGMIESPGTGWKESGLGIAGIKKYMISKTVFVETIDGTRPPL